MTPNNSELEKEIDRALDRVYLMKPKAIVKPSAIVEAEKEKLLALIHTETQRAVERFAQDKMLEQIREWSPFDITMFCGGLIYDLFMRETNATTTTLEIKDFSYKGKHLGNLKIRVTINQSKDKL